MRRFRMPRMWRCFESRANNWHTRGPSPGARGSGRRETQFQPICLHGKKQRMANSHSKRCKSSTMLAKQGKGMKRTSNNQNSKPNQTSIILHRAQIPPSNSTLQSAQKQTLTPHRRRLACNLKSAHTYVIGLTRIPIAKGIWEKIIVKLLGPNPHCSFIAFCVLCPNLYIQLQLQHSIIPDMFDSRLVLGLFVLLCFSISIVLFIRMFLGLIGADSVLCS